MTVMNNSVSSRVNQKIVFARGLLQVAKAIEGVDVRAKLQRQAGLEAVCFHLYSAYLIYLNEVAEGYKVVLSTSATSSLALVEALKAAGKVAPEAEELKTLEQAANSWLDQLQRCFQAALKGTVEQGGQAGSPPDVANQISAVDLSARGDDNRITPERAAEWLDRLTELVDRHRQTMVEY